jgi:cytosine/adenosine deaminase-related metal-dependent hydrolase
MSLILKNISLFFGEDLNFIDNGYIVIEEGIIKRAGIGEYHEFDKKDTILDGQGILACPGFINSHTHVGDSVGKDIGVNFSLNGLVHPVQGTRRTVLDRETLVKFVRGSLFSMMNKGIVAFADFGEGEIDGIELLNEAASGLNIKPIVLGRPEFYFDLSKRLVSKDIPRSTIDTAIAILKVANGLGISGANENTDEAMCQYRNLKNEYGVKNTSLLAIHAAESLHTSEFSVLMTGRRELDRIFDFLNPDFIIHLTKALDNEINLLAKNSTGIVVCPRSNGVLGVGFPRIAKMIQSKCCVGIGTDNIMVNSPDMFREMDYIWNVSRTFDESISAREILKMATVNGGKILRLNSGCISPNKSADIMFIDKNNIDLCPMHDPYISMVHRASEDCILNLMINGEFVYGNGF